MTSVDSGFFESSLSRTRSLIRTHSTHTRDLIRRQSLQVFSHKITDSPSRPSPRPELDPGLTPSTTTMLSPSPSSLKRPTKRGSKSSTRKSTILRAVPAASAASPTAPLSALERDMATLPNQEIISTIKDSGRSSPADSVSSLPHHNNLVRTKVRSRSTNALCSIKAGTETNFSSNLQGAIGTYRHGKIEWGPVSASNSTRSKRPKIQVVIPEHQRDRPLPTSPFFSHGNNSHVRSASAEFASIDDVSPPSGSKRPLARTSVVSPLTSLQQRTPPKKVDASIDSQMTKPATEVEGRTAVPPASHSHSSSEDSHGDDGSSLYSRCSSRTSAGAHTPPLEQNEQKPRDLLERSANSDFSVKNPVAAGVFDGEAGAPHQSDNATTQNETGPRAATPSSPLPPPPPPPRRYAHHVPIEQDVEWVPTCPHRPHRPHRPVRPAPVLAPAPLDLQPQQPAVARKPTINRKSTVKRRCSQRGSKTRTLLISPTIGFLDQAIFRVESKKIPEPETSPTLSEAETELEKHLTGTFPAESAFRWADSVQRCDSISTRASSPTPAVPRKSSRRQSAYTSGNFRISRVPADHIASQLRHSRSSVMAKGLKIEIPGAAPPLPSESDVAPIPIPPKALKRTITPDVAENVLLRIFRNLETLDDLFATAMVNWGFFRVFKRYELELMKATLRKMSPPAWEHREICYPGHDQHNLEDLEADLPRSDYSPSTFIEHHERDIYIINAVKALIKEECQSFLRPEIATALVSSEPSMSARVDDALWRIWTFCKIFGCGKGREEDVVAQMDWLRGGVLVHQNTCTQSIFTTDALDMNDTLANAPECFAKGNEGGLDAEELFDMMELWNCLGVLLQPIGTEGNVVQARQYGVFDRTEIRGGDVDGEEIMLDEWYYYLLTLGLSPILELAGACQKPDSAAFLLAQQKSWVDWKAPIHGGTRRNFLKEATARVYEDKIANTYAEASTKDVQRQIAKQRIQRHITELRRLKNSGERLMEVRMSQERPMSEWEGVFHSLTRPRPGPSSNIVSHIPSLRSTSMLAQEIPSVSELPDESSQPPRPRSPPRRIVAQPLLPTPPPSTVPSVADRSSMFSSMPSIDEHPAFRPHESIPEMPSLEHHPAFSQYLREMSAPAQPAPSSSRSASPNRPSVEEHPVFQQHPLQHDILSSDPSENSAEKAVYRIVEMGFTPEQARQALRRTDLGDGLRVDRAVELLLREGL